ncbi:MAG: histidine phosphatase family protein, partial [Patescibacteria group bacterium]|nr:histidine phosphatase family protein [Patescibacteria group bacterium]
MKTTIILARHGQSVWNKKRVLQGCTDSSLTKEGIKQAEALAKKIKNMGVTKIVSSNLKRAVQTAEIIAKEVALNFEKYPRLNERSFGKLEGKSWIEIEKEFEDMSKFFLQTPEGGESQEDFTNRVTGEFKAIISKNYGQTLLLVCHGG